MKLLDRYIVKELLFPFLFGVAIFSTLFVASGLLFQIAKMMAQQGIPLFLVAKYFFAKMPATILYAFPMATLLATLLAFGRLSTDNEVIALRAGGVSFPRIAAPALLFALAITLLAIVLNDKIAPKTNLLANTTLETEIRKQGRKNLSNLALFSNTSQGLSRLTFVRKFDEEIETMLGVNVWDSYEHTQDNKRIVETVRNITAQEAQWVKGSWLFRDGSIVEYEKQAVKYHAKFDTMVVDIKDTPAQILKQHRNPDEMDSASIKRKIATLTKVASDIGEVPKDIINLKLEFHQKISIPCASFVFAFIGIPFGLRPHRSSSSVGLGISMILIFIYYVFLYIGLTLGGANKIPPFLATWLPNFIFLIFGSYLIANTNQ